MKLRHTSVAYLFFLCRRVYLWWFIFFVLVSWKCFVEHSWENVIFRCLFPLECLSRTRNLNTTRARKNHTCPTSCCEIYYSSVFNITLHKIKPKNIRILKTLEASVFYYGMLSCSDYKIFQEIILIVCT